MLLFFSILGIFLSVIFLYYNARKNIAIIYLAGFFFLISLYVFTQYGFLYSKSVLLVTVLLILFPILIPLLYLTGPMLYWYVRGVLSDHARLKKTDFLHLLPMLFYFGASLPYFLLPLSAKQETAKQLVNNVGIMQTYSATFLSKIFPVLDVYLSRPVLLAAYAIWSLVLVLNYSLRKKQKEVFFRQGFMMKWLILLLILVLLLSASHIILIIHTFKLNFSEYAFGLNMVSIVSAIGLIALMISPFFFPSILYGLPRFSGNRDLSCVRSTNSVAEEPNHLPTHFEKDYLRSIGERVDDFMHAHKPYTYPHFNINQLGVRLNVPVHHLAFYFREVKKQTFSQYQNRWRVANAKKLMEAGKSHELTLEAIATLSGFSNRNSFRSVFQKLEGMCPSTFSHQQKELP